MSEQDLAFVVLFGVPVLTVLIYTLVWRYKHPRERARFDHKE